MPPDGEQLALADGERRNDAAVWEGFSNALAHAVELVGVTVLFLLAGLWLDSRTGTRPLFMLLLGLFAVAGLGVRAYYVYKAQIARDEEGKPWTRSRR